MGYPYSVGFRDKHFLNTDISSGNLTELFTIDELSDKLKSYDGQRVLAIYSQRRILSGKTSLKNNLVGCVFYEGISRGLVRSSLSFEKALVEIAADRLVDIILLSELSPIANNPKKYQFVTLCQEFSMEAVSTDAAHAYRSIIGSGTNSEMQLALRSISNVDKL
jgi:hypothetical protein